MASARDLELFKKATQLVYGPVHHLSEQAAEAWTPPDNPGAGGHRGRYLWTDAFGVINFLTLSKETCSSAYLILAKRLASTVHTVLGGTRDGTARLPLATEAEPLKGGLRIGKAEAHGSDGDGQYHHYLTLWMFALNRLALATGEGEYNQLAVQLAKAIHPRFVISRGPRDRLRMVWKVSADLERVLVPSEGHLDAATGFVVYRLLQRATEHFDRSSNGSISSSSGILDGEIAEYRELMGREGKMRAGHDPLDLGMGLWMCHFFKDEQWARDIGSQSLAMARLVFDENSGLLGRDASRRLAFREFGACLGIRCYGADEGLEAQVRNVMRFWQTCLESTDDDLRPISLVMYAAALVPGAFHDGYLDYSDG